MLREGELVTQGKGYKDVWGVENLGEEAGKALLVWFMKTENYIISLSKSVWC